MDTFFDVSEAIITYGLLGSNYLKYVLPLLCLAGLILMIASHKLPFSVSYAWHKGIAVAMGLIVVFSVCYCLLGVLHAYVVDGYAMLAVLIFLGNMLFPLIFSVAGLILWFYSRYPIMKPAAQPQSPA